MGGAGVCPGKNVGRDYIVFEQVCEGVRVCDWIMCEGVCGGGGGWVSGLCVRVGSCYLSFSSNFQL